MFLPEQTLLAIRHLVQVASAENVTILGFSVSHKPVEVTAFGNCKEGCADIKMYEILCEAYSRGKKEGRVEVKIVEEPV